MKLRSWLLRGSMLMLVGLGSCSPLSSQKIILATEGMPVIVLEEVKGVEGAVLVEGEWRRGKVDIMPGWALVPPSYYNKK